MTGRDFCFWLQGYFEMTAAGKHPDDASLTNVQGDAIRRHLALVFKHEIDPSMGPPDHQAKLNEVHVTDETPKPERPKPQIGGGHSPFGPVMRC